MAVLLTYPHVGFVEYQGDLSAQFDADGTLRLVLLGHEGFAGGAAHEGVNAWSTEYTQLIQARESAALRRFMERSLAEWVSYQCQTHDLPGEIGKSSLNFSKWDYVRDTNVLVFDVESRNDELWILKAVKVYPKKLLLLRPGENVVHPRGGVRGDVEKTISGDAGARLGPTGARQPVSLPPNLQIYRKAWVVLFSSLAP